MDKNFIIPIIVVLSLYIGIVGYTIIIDNQERTDTISKIDTLSDDQLRLFVKQCVTNRAACRL